ncbi:hypothetical protein CG007_02270 [Mesoplasma entomophilum]|uniref:hypothetical protein n=1 Tax=Mesoplasma entomophilum TaxID=2149 RepID=UPI000D047244|nr:hypothetical protein [Mesoplasma entomophilum]AVN60430.1 hypothetical protein CG007_02270 [Mesoplasma entomophilum]
MRNKNILIMGNGFDIFFNKNMSIKNIYSILIDSHSGLLLLKNFITKFNSEFSNFKITYSDEEILEIYQAIRRNLINPLKDDSIESIFIKICLELRKIKEVEKTLKHLFCYWIEIQGYEINKELNKHVYNNNKYVKEEFNDFFRHYDLIITTNYNTYDSFQECIKDKTKIINIHGAIKEGSSPYVRYGDIALGFDEKPKIEEIIKNKKVDEIIDQSFRIDIFGLSLIGDMEIKKFIENLDREGKRIQLFAFSESDIKYFNDFKKTLFNNSRNEVLYSKSDFFKKVDYLIKFSNFIYSKFYDYFKNELKSQAFIDENLANNIIFEENNFNCSYENCFYKNIDEGSYIDKMSYLYSWIELNYNSEKNVEQKTDFEIKQSFDDFLEEITLSLFRDDINFYKNHINNLFSLDRSIIKEICVNPDFQYSVSEKSLEENENNKKIHLKCQIKKLINWFEQN